MQILHGQPQTRQVDGLQQQDQHPSPTASSTSATATGTTSIIRFERLSRSWIIITVPTFLV